jgi:alkylated DNA repair dioxygenase AlkB
MRGVDERPDGFTYRPAVVGVEEERSLLHVLRGLDFGPVVMHGRAARRTVRQFGYAYDFDTWQIAQTDPIPDYLTDMRARCAELTGTDPALFEQALVTYYPPGAPIGWHRDANAFGPAVAGLSLGSDCLMRFQRRAAGGAESALHVLGGAMPGHALVPLHDQLRASHVDAHEDVAGLLAALRAMAGLGLVFERAEHLEADAAAQAGTFHRADLAG